MSNFEPFNLGSNKSKISKKDKKSRYDNLPNNSIDATQELLNVSYNATKNKKLLKDPGNIASKRKFYGGGKNFVPFQSNLYEDLKVHESEEDEPTAVQNSNLIQSFTPLGKKEFYDFYRRGREFFSRRFYSNCSYSEEKDAAEYCGSAA